MELADSLADSREFFGFLGQVFSFTELQVYVLFAVFIRVGAVVAMLPGFGEQLLPARVRLFGTFAFTAIVWPAVGGAISPPAAIAEALNAGGGPGEYGGAPLALGLLFLAEAANGLALGIVIRFMVMALQLAGSIIAQSTAVAQIFGNVAAPDPMPAAGNLLFLAGITLALSAGLHVKAVLAMIGSYNVLPFGLFPVAGDLAEWGVARAMEAFALAFGLAAPFVIASLAYNFTLGAINRAMPQLMVALVGAPAITAGALIFLLIAGPVGLTHWSGELDLLLAAPFRMP